MVCRRSYSSTVDKSSLSKLRKKTGFTLINCKKALEQFNNDIKQAEKWMREQAQKEGWAKATKLEGRAMSQGLVGLKKDLNSATLVEINCETDFVAKNEKFMNLVSRVASVCESYFNMKQENKVNLNKTEMSSLTDEEGKTLSDLVALEIGNIGENMAIRRASYMKIPDSSVLGTYIHASGQPVDINNCVTGKYGAVVEVRNTNNEVLDNSTLIPIANNLAQHIVGMKTKTIGNHDDKPEADKDEETKLLFQEWLIDSNYKVSEVLEKNNIEVKDFVRFECGEAEESES